MLAAALGIAGAGIATLLCAKNILRSKIKEFIWSPYALNSLKRLLVHVDGN